MESEIQESRFQNAVGALATQFEAKPNWHGRSQAGCNQEAFTAKPQSRKDRQGARREEVGGRWAVTAPRGRGALTGKTQDFKIQEAGRLFGGSELGMDVPRLDWDKMSQLQEEVSRKMQDTAGETPALPF